MPTIYNGEEIDLVVSEGLGVESRLSGVWLTAEPEEVVYTISLLPGQDCAEKSVLQLLIFRWANLN